MVGRFLILNILLLVTACLSQDSLRSTNESLSLINETLNANDTFSDSNNDTALYQRLISENNVDITIDKIKIKNKIEDENKNKTNIKTDVRDESDSSFTNIERNSENNNTSIFMPFQHNILKLIDHLSIHIGKITFEGLKNVIKGKYVVNPTMNTEKDITFADQNVVGDLDGETNSSDPSLAPSLPATHPKSQISQDQSDVTIMPTQVFIPEKVNGPETLQLRGALKSTPQFPYSSENFSPSILISEENNFGEFPFDTENETSTEQGFKVDDDDHEPVEFHRYRSSPSMKDRNYSPPPQNPSHNRRHHQHHHLHLPVKDGASQISSTSTTGPISTTDSQASTTDSQASTTDSQASTTSTPASTASTTDSQASTTSTPASTASTTDSQTSPTSTSIPAFMYESKEDAEEEDAIGKRSLRRLGSTGVSRSEKNKTEFDVRQDDDDDDDLDDDLDEEAEQEKNKSKNEGGVADTNSPSKVSLITLMAKEAKYCGEGVGVLRDLYENFRKSIGKLFNLSPEKVLIVKMSPSNGSFVNCNSSRSKESHTGVKFTFLIDTKLESSYIFKMLELAASDKNSFLVKELGKIGFVQISKNIA
ncbi:putative protein rich in Thr and Ser [Cryptosporidium canis]|uniref:Signal peptide-containing protein n=1 Tax=Cryptosporidium canis TaxID=195482 RepID=A0A9D5DLZ6_9CRYT|nr:putative protein rich in Thr and Ser [Cryptosporidium canis]